MDNKNYSVQNQAKRGLSTFVLTLSISLIVFSTIYYLMTSNSSEAEDTARVGYFNDSSDTSYKAEVRGAEGSQKTIFGEIADATPNSSYKQVLAGSDEVTTTNTTTTTTPTTTIVTQTTQSATNLNTGSTSVTFGLLSAFALFISAVVFVSKNPRKLALSSFERKTTKNL